MSAPQKRFERLLQVRLAKERVRAADHAASLRALSQAEQQLACVSATLEQSQQAGRDGLVQGEWSAWWMGESVAALAVRELSACSDRCSALADDVAAKKKELEQSQRATEQVKLLHEAALSVWQKEQDKRAQAESDDRFAARAYWCALQ